MTRPTQEEIERVARALARADDLNPDAVVYYDPVLRVRGGFVVADRGRPVWATYAPAATMAIDALRSAVGD